MVLCHSYIQAIIVWIIIEFFTVSKRASTFNSLENNEFTNNNRSNNNNSEKNNNNNYQYIIIFIIMEANLSFLILELCYANSMFVK